MEDLLEEWLSAPGAYPEARRAIDALAPMVREELNRGLDPIDLHAGETLFAGGDPRDAVFLILRGRISLTEPCSQGGVLPVRVFGAGEGVGEIGVAACGPYTATARALDDTRVLRLGKIPFEGLCERHPEAMQRFADFIAPVADETLLSRVICDLLGERDAAQLAALLAEIECLPLKRSDVLVREGEDADRLFVVV
ncbi:MAG: cyclic nucleotide-binding domain-containing protein, partial [Anaerolineae bacterium]|nr:cyclic nucleotide-binding domain-containing protein [Anaerolineae bacterium]